MGMMETDYTSLAPKTEQEMRDDSKALTVKAIEDSHRTLNVAAQQNLNNKLSRHSRWHTMQTSQIIPDYDVKQVEPSRSDQVEAKKNAKSTRLNGAMYTPKSMPFSLGDSSYAGELLERDIRLHGGLN